MSSVSSGNSGNSQRGAKPRKKRVRNWSETDRAAHAIIEKGRREAFNEQLLLLASLLPALDAAKSTQLTKHVIVHESIEHIRAQHNALRTSTEQATAVARERDALLVEVNQWRSACGMPTRLPTTQPRLDDLATIDEHVPFGSNPLPGTTSFTPALPVIGETTTPQPVNPHAVLAGGAVSHHNAFQHGTSGPESQSIEAAPMYTGNNIPIYQPHSMHYMPYTMPTT